METTTKPRFKKIIILLKFTVLLTLLVGIPLYLYFFHADRLPDFQSLEDVERYLNRNLLASIFIYIGIQALQIVISIIPGHAVLQFAAGYVYGFWLGYLVTAAGIALGTLCTFYLARLLGKDAMYLFFGEERFTRMIKRLDSKRALVVIFVVYLIPGLPKDLIGYAAGVSNMKFLPFLILSLTARTPVIMGGVLIGIMTDDGSYAAAIIIAALVVVFCILGVVFRKKIMAWIDKGFGAH